MSAFSPALSGIAPPYPPLPGPTTILQGPAPMAVCLGRLRGHSLTWGEWIAPCSVLPNISVHILAIVFRESLTFFVHTSVSLVRPFAPWGRDRLHPPLGPVSRIAPGSRQTVPKCFLKGWMNRVPHHFCIVIYLSDFSVTAKRRAGESKRLGNLWWFKKNPPTFGNKEKTGWQVAW